MFANEQQFSDTIFKSNVNNFDELCLHAFRYQYENNKIYQEYCNYTGISNPGLVCEPAQIPFLPVELFKTHDILTGDKPPKLVFSSSATGGNGQSRHLLTHVAIYEESFTSGFERIFGSARNYCFLALLPSYLEREGSSLIYMVQHLMRRSGHPLNGYFLYEHHTLNQRIVQLEKLKQPYILFGVSFALLDFAAHAPTPINIGTIIETGGMKGRRKELTKMEVHQLLEDALQTKAIYSEYGMTELLSQAYAPNNDMYTCPPWMRVFITDPNDPMSYLEPGRTGCINVTDLANINSCCFIKTSDLGRKNDKGQFEVLGRIDNSDLRGCSLMVN